MRFRPVNIREFHGIQRLTLIARAESRIDQIAEGTGILLPDPADLEAFGAAARRLLSDQDQAARMGQAAHAHIREQYVGHALLLRYARLLGTLIGGE